MWKKEKITDFQHFHFFPQHFRKPSSCMFGKTKNSVENLQRRAHQVRIRPENIEINKVVFPFFMLFPIWYFVLMGIS